MLTVTLNGVEVEALIDTGCGWNVTKRAKRPYTPNVLCIQCIHGDIQRNRTKMLTVLKVYLQGEGCSPVGLRSADRERLLCPSTVA